MWYIGVWEQNEGLTQLVQELVAGKQSRIQTGSHPAELTGAWMDLLVVSPCAVGWAGAAALYSRTVLLPNSAGPVVRSLLAERVISYGMGHRDTITISSLQEERACIAIQREIIRLDGGLVERQELVLSRPDGESAELMLAKTGVRLLLGLLEEG